MIKTKQVKLFSSRSVYQYAHRKYISKYAQRVVCCSSFQASFFFVSFFTGSSRSFFLLCFRSRQLSLKIGLVSSSLSLHGFIFQSIEHIVLFGGIHALHKLSVPFLGCLLLLIRLNLLLNQLNLFRRQFLRLFTLIVSTSILFIGCLAACVRFLDKFKQFFFFSGWNIV